MIAEIEAELSSHGLMVRGLSPIAEGEWGRAKTALLVGNVGAAYWEHFSAWRSEEAGELVNPLDTWSRMVISKTATRFGATVIMPNDRPYAPFQQWAMRAEMLRPSPLGLLIHPRYGLWHAYRGAMLFEAEISIQVVREAIHPCELCASKPCLNACPVQAFSVGEFDYQSCLSHVRGPDGAACREHGCLARNACPVGQAFRYPAEVQAFHQKAFAGL